MYMACIVLEHVAMKNIKFLTKQRNFSIKKNII